MKSLRIFISFTLLAFCFSCSSKPSANAEKNDEVSSVNSDRIEAYYFHFTARCVTCLTIEAKAKEYLETLYPNLINSGLLTFQSLNLEEDATKPIAKRLGVTGQCLLIVKGEQKIDLTNEGFLYAVVKPEKFREIINEKVDGLLIR